MYNEAPEVYQYMLSSFQKIDPTVAGMMEADEAVAEMIKTIHRLDLRMSGKVLSHYGDEKWF